MTPQLTLGRDEHGADLSLEPEALRTHGVVVGMTGSGKTGLCVVMLEELAQAGVPIIAIDPKGDLGNLALLFPDLAPTDFLPWVEPGQDPVALAASWRQGLAESGIQPERIAALKQRMDLRILTPGSESGQPVDVLAAFRRPAAAALQDAEAVRELVAGSISGLLGLVGQEADPVRDPAHIVLSQVLERAWLAGEDPDLETLILRLLDPPFEKVGVFPVDRFFPPDARMDLAMKLNGVIASPSFSAWTHGAPLDIEAMLGGPGGPPPGGRVPVTVVHLAHLPDGQRLFFLSLLLGRLRAWSRAMPGSSSLRALLFFDEIAGYLPPHPHNPPTKEPLLGMMKQARAVGLGLLLATQNPVDLDYKALSNAGLWFIGRLQTPQDRDRLLKGMGKPELDEAVAGLGKRRFLLVDAGSDTPRIFGTRFAMSFLRGPLTRTELARLSPASPPPSAPPPAIPVSTLLSAAPPAPGECLFLDPRVAFSARLHEHFAPLAEPARPDGRLALRPALLAELELRFDEERQGFVLDHHEFRVWYPLEEGLPEPFSVRFEPGDLLASAPANALYHPLPAWVDEPKELQALQKQILDEVLRSESRGMFVHPGLKLYGRGGEDREAFEARVREAIQARVDEEVGKLREKAARDSKRIEDRIATAQAKIVEQQGLVRARQLQEAVNVGETLMSLFSGRKRSLNTAMSKRQQTSQAQARLDQAEQQVRDLQQEAYELENELEEAVKRIEDTHAASLAQIEEKPVGLERSDLRLVRFGILWVPASVRLPA